MLEGLLQHLRFAEQAKRVPRQLINPAREVTDVHLEVVRDDARGGPAACSACRWFFSRDHAQLHENSLKRLLGLERHPLGVTAE